MDERIAYCINAELSFARSKFPGSNLNFAALVEEVGELSNALLDHKYGKSPAENVFAEAIQVAVMAIRVATEGSSEFPYIFEHSHYQAFDVNKAIVPVKFRRELKVDIRKCQRCGDDHDQMPFKKLFNPSDEWTHFGFCPKTKQPVTLRIVETPEENEQGK